MRKTIRISMIPLALIVLLASVALYFALPHKVEAVGITGAWDPDDVGTVFVIDGNDYIVESDDKYTKKYITYNEAKYYVIENAADLEKMVQTTEQTSITVRAILTDNITLTSNSTARNCYGLLLEGNNKTVTFTNCGRGLFHNFSGIVRNVTLTGSISQTSGTAAIAAWAKGIELENVHSSVNVTVAQTSAQANGNAQNAYVGGLVACVQATKLSGAFSDSNYVAILTNCSNSGTVTITNHGGYAGGLVGGLQVDAKLTGCVNTGNVVDTTVTDLDKITGSQNGSRAIGGLVGTITNGSKKDVSFINCTNGSSEDANLGTVTSVYKCAGGLAGYCAGTSVSFSNCKNYATINNSSTQNASGIMGQANTISLTDCSNMGTINGNGSSTGSMVGYCGTKATVKDCTNNGALSSNATVGGIIGKSNGAVTMSGTVNNGSVTSRNGNNAENTSVGGIVGCFRNAKTHSFTNVVNNGNVSVTQKSGWAGGFIGSISDVGATITLTNCAVNGDVSTSGELAGSFAYGTVGGFVGGSYNQNGTNGLISITIKDSVCTGDVTANGTVLNYAGGYVGYLGHGSADAQITVQDSAFVGTVTNASTDENAKTAAFIGYTNKDFTITRSFSYATLEGSSNYALAFADGAAASVSNAIVNSNAAATLDNGDATLKSPAAFAAGEVAYLLNTAKGSTVWYQTIGTDAAPVANNTHGTVYQVDLTTPSHKAIGKTYSNTEGVEVRFSLSTTAEKRTDPNGIRWITVMDAYHMEVLKAAVMAGTANLEGAGTLIAPVPFVSAAGGLQHSMLVAWLESKGFTASDLDEISFDIPGMDGWYNGQEGTFAGSVANIREENKGIPYLGVGYIVVDGEYIYAASLAAFAYAD